MVLFHHIDCPVSLGPATVLEGKNLLTVMRHLKHTIKKNQTNANAVGVLLCKPFQGTNAFSVINDYASSRADRHRQPQQRKVVQMQPVWLCVISSEPFEEAFDNTYRGRTTAVHCKRADWVFFLLNVKIYSLPTHIYKT